MTFYVVRKKSRASIKDLRKRLKWLINEPENQLMRSALAGLNLELGARKPVTLTFCFFRSVNESE